MTGPYQPAMGEPDEAWCRRYLEHPAIQKYLATHDAEAARLDVGRVKQAVENVARRHGLQADPPIPYSVARIFGYSAAPAVMDAEIADEYARLAP